MNDGDVEGGHANVPDPRLFEGIGKGWGIMAKEAGIGGGANLGPVVIDSHYALRRNRSYFHVHTRSARMIGSTASISRGSH